MKKFNWILTDDDCCQYIRAAFDVGPRCYECVQLIEYPAELSEKLGSEYGIAHAFVDLDDYSSEELWEIMRSYYSPCEIASIGQLIKAECVFECEALDSIVKNVSNRQEAEKCIQDIIWQDVMFVNKDDEDDNYAFLPINIEASVSIIKLLKMFDELYGNTAQNLSDWAAEFQLITRMLIHHNAILVNPIHLEIDEETLVQILMNIPYEHDRELYQQAREYLRLSKEENI